MTACFKLMRALGTYERENGEQHCSPCVYFSRNLDPADHPELAGSKDACGLGFLSGDPGCTEMRTDNCSARKIR